MIYYKGYKIKYSKVRERYICMLKNYKISGIPYWIISESYNEVKGEIRLDIERGKR